MRQRQAAANDKRRRQQTELERATEFEVARIRRDEPAAPVVTHKIESRPAPVGHLLVRGNSVVRVAELAGETEAEIR